MPPRPEPARLVVLVSGTGSNLAALIEACADASYGAAIVAVGADRDEIPALAKADAVAIPTFVTPLGDHPDRSAWDQALTEATAKYEPTLVVCAGFMKILGPEFLARFGPGIVNTHPALLPSFPGATPVRDTLAHAVKVTGVTVHFVDAGLDAGPIVAQAAVPVLDDDDEDRLHERIKGVERTLLVETVGRLVRDGYRIEGRKVLVP
ncbi:MAG: phosphoribosylglycinamide formyltransferase [Actinomycetes bacterium]